MLKIEDVNDNPVGSPEQFRPVKQGLSTAMVEMMKQQQPSVKSPSESLLGWSRGQP